MAMKTTVGFGGFFAGRFTSGWQMCALALALLLSPGRLRAADLTPPVVDFEPLTADQVVADLAALGGPATDADGIVTVVRFTLREVPEIGLPERWWNGAAWQAEPAELAGAVAAGRWTPAEGVALPPLNSGLAFEITVTAVDDSANLAGPVSLRVRAQTRTLDWDDGATHEGTVALEQPHLLGGAHIFRVVTRNTAVGAWRTALAVTAGEAAVFLHPGAVPSVGGAAYGSNGAGSDGFVVSEFAENQEWFLVVVSLPEARWRLVTGEAFVRDLGALPGPEAAGDTAVTVGPEGWHYFRTVPTPETLAWRLWLRNLDARLHVRADFAPVAGNADLRQDRAMLVVPGYLQAGTTYFVGVPAAPGTAFTLHSKQQPVAPLAFGAEAAGLATDGFPYLTHRIEVPLEQIAWEVRAVPGTGNTDLALRRGLVPNEWDNDAFSEVPGAVADSVTLVPPVLSDGTFYVTTYGTAARTFSLHNGEPTITPRDYAAVTVNDDPDRAGWRYYVVRDIPGQLGTLGWELDLAGHRAGTELALRRNAVPGRWRSRSGGFEQFVQPWHDFSGTGGFLQRPGHQADIWYVGVYQPDASLGAFTLITGPIEPAPVGFGGSTTQVTDLAPGRWRFFRVDFPAEALGWDGRLVNAESGLPQLAVRRDLLPEGLGPVVNFAATEWPTGAQHTAGSDWTQLYQDADGRSATGEIFAFGRGNALQTGTYYVGVFNQSTTSPARFAFRSRGIGEGYGLPVAELPFAGGRVVHDAGLPAREATYYRVEVPPNQRSWQIRLTPQVGEVLLLADDLVIPQIQQGAFPELATGGRHLIKHGPEHLLVLPREGEEFLRPGPHFLGVVSEGIAPDRAAGWSGTGLATFTLESIGPAPVAALGTVPPVGGGVLSRAMALAGGEIQVLEFTAPSGLAALEIRLRNRTGNPALTVRPGQVAAWPQVPLANNDRYGADAGWLAGREEGFEIATVPNPLPGTYTVTVKAERSGEGFPDATAELTVEAVASAPLAFDGGAEAVAGQLPGGWRFFSVTVPDGVVGWDVRIGDVTGGRPELFVRRGDLPERTRGSLDLHGRAWPEGAQFTPGVDWTQKASAADPDAHFRRVFTAGLGNPLEPGSYVVGVLNSSDQPTSYRVLSRGIGEGLQLPVRELAFAGASAEVPDLAPRESAYFRVLVPPDAPSLKVRLSSVSGESVLLAQAGVLPNIALDHYIWRTTDRGVRVQQEGPEHFLLLPTEDATVIPPGPLFLAAVSEGSGGSGSLVGDAPVTLRLEVGPAPVVDLGPLTALGELSRSVALEGAEVQILRFRLDAPVASVEIRLEDRSGTPDLAVRAGAHVPNPHVPLNSAGYFGVEGGWHSLRQEAYGSAPTTIVTLSDPPVGDVFITVRAGYESGSGEYVSAGARVVVQAFGAAPLAFDGGRAVVTGQAPGSWRFFVVDVPAEAVGWDLRLEGVAGGNAGIFVRRDSLPSLQAPQVLPWADTWETGLQWGPSWDLTELYDPDPVTGSPYGHFFLAGRGGPLEPGRYFVGVRVDDTAAQPGNWSLRSRGIGEGLSLPVTPLDFAGGSGTHPGLAPREIAWFSVDVPAGAPNWQVKLDASQGGEALLALRRGRLPNHASRTFTAHVDDWGRVTARAGNEHFLLLPEEGQTELAGGRYFLGVVSEGVGPMPPLIGTGPSPFTLHSRGSVPVTPLGEVPALGGRLEREVAVEGGETTLFRFDVPAGVEWIEARLANRLGTPALALRAGETFPDPSVPVRPFGQGYGSDGGHLAGRFEDRALVTLVRPAAGPWTLTVKGESSGADSPDASAQLQIEQLRPGELAFSGGSATASLADSQRTFYRVEVPDGVLGWQLDLDIANGSPLVRARRGVLPSDAEPGFVSFGGPSIVIAPPVLQPGTWFVEVKGVGVSEFTLRSGPVELHRPAWTMPALGAPVATPGLPAEGTTFADTGVDAAGNPLPDDQGVDLGDGDFHHYGLVVPAGNGGLLRGELLALSGNPDAFVRAGAVPTLAHGEFTAGQLHDFSLTGTGSEYGNWVPLDGRTEMELRPGPWFIAVRANASNVRYRLRLSVGQVTEIAPGEVLTGQSIAAGDWRYFRFRLPVEAPAEGTITWNSQQGDADLFVRDTVPPGEPLVSGWGYRDWNLDRKNGGPYPQFPDAGEYPVGVPPLRPGSVYYLGFRAVNDATFTVSTRFSGAVIDVPHTVNFYGGTATVNLPPGGRASFRVPVPSEATSWRHRTVHADAVQVFLDQGTLPVFGTPERDSFIFSRTGPEGERQVVFLGTWPWVANASYYFTAVNPSATAQPFTVEMDGRNATNDDTDLDGLPDSWEMAHFPGLAEGPGGDFDLDGVSNADELAEGTNPANRSSLRPRLLVEVVGSGRIVKEPDLPSYPLGTRVRLFAVPDSGFAFARWEGPDIASALNPLVLDLTASQQVTALFVSGEIPLEAGAPSLVGGGSGFRAAFTGPAAGALIIETSADLMVWTEFRRVEPFPGSYLLEVVDLLAGGHYFRARIER